MNSGIEPPICEVNVLMGRVNYAKNSNFGAIHWESLQVEMLKISRVAVEMFSKELH